MATLNIYNKKGEYIRIIVKKKNHLKIVKNFTKTIIM